MIVVTGVHRSGTSLLAMFIEALGVDFGPHEAFYSADRWNEKGYYERRDVMDLNSRLVTGFSRTHGSLPAVLSQFVYGAGPSRSGMARRAFRLDHDIKRLADHLDSFAVKDPRFCLTLPFWQEHARINRCVVALRHPREVAMSLKRRQRVPIPMGLRFWERHMAALLESSPQRSLFVDHAALVGTEPDAELERVSSFFGLDATRADLTRRFRSVHAPRLVHAAADHDTALPASTSRLWEAAQDRRRKGERDPR